MMGGVPGRRFVGVGRAGGDLGGFHMTIEGEREAGVEPSLWQDVTIVFELKGNKMKGGKLDKRVYLK